MNPAINAIIPLLILISLGFLSRRSGILKAGDECDVNGDVDDRFEPSI